MVNKSDLPLGFSFALAQKPEAMKAFSHLPEAKRSEIIQRAHTVTSKSEMQSLVNCLPSQGRSIPTAE